MQKAKAVTLQKFCKIIVPNIILHFCCFPLATFLFTYLMHARVKTAHAAMGAVVAVLVCRRLCAKLQYTYEPRTDSSETHTEQ